MKNDQFQEMQPPEDAKRKSQPTNEEKPSKKVKKRPQSDVSEEEEEGQIDDFDSESDNVSEPETEDASDDSYLDEA